MNGAQHASAARTRVWLDLPSGEGAHALRSGLTTMGLIPQPLPIDPAPRKQALATLASGALAFIDVSDPALHGRRPLDALLQGLPAPAAANRIVLSRTRGGHVSPQDRAWMQSLGFADLHPDWLGGPDHRVLRGVLNWTASLTGLDEPAPHDLPACARISSGSGDDTVAARAVVWALAGESPETLAARLAGSLDIADRRWHFHAYPRCFVGSQAAEQLMHTLQRPREEVLALGQALGELGLLAHVVHEHPFLDEELFYRMAWSDVLDQVDAAALWQTVEDEMPARTATRSHLGRSYADCFVGSEMVTFVAERYALHRADAWLALYRMARWGWIEHVTRARPFIDGAFFYRWKGGSPGA